MVGEKKINNSLLFSLPFTSLTSECISFKTHKVMHRISHIFSHSGKKRSKEEETVCLLIIIIIKLVVLRGDVQTTVNCLFDEIVCFFFSSLFFLLREREMLTQMWKKGLSPEEKAERTDLLLTCPPLLIYALNYSRRILENTVQYCVTERRASEGGTSTVTSRRRPSRSTCSVNSKYGRHCARSSLCCE